MYERQYQHEPTGRLPIKVGFFSIKDEKTLEVRNSLMESTGAIDYKENILYKFLSNSSGSVRPSEISSNKSTAKVINQETEFDSLSDQLSEIRRNFGLNMTQLATTLKSSRKSPYIWMNGQVQNLHSEKRQRISDLLSLARYWKELSQGKQAGKIQAMIDGESLLSLLSEATLDKVRIKSFMEKINRIGTTYRKENTQAAQALLLASKSVEYPMVSATENNPIYGIDKDSPGLIIETHKDGRKIRGKMVQGQFVAID